MPRYFLQRGATLIELLVTISIFTILLIMITGIFSRFVTMERRDISERALQEDIRLALEQFVREARTAYGSTYALFPSSAGEMVVFRNQNKTCVAYKLGDGVFERAENFTSDPCDTVSYTDFVPLTSEKTIVENVHFFLPESIVLNGELNRQGFITLSIRAKSANSSIPAFEIQTTITSRQIQFSE